MTRWSDREIARAISRVESEGGSAAPSAPRQAHVVGFTGPPGAGKSTLVDRVVTQARADGRTVAVLAVDPSSPLTGGAVLADRVRMGRHAADPGVFIRSMGSRGATNGLAEASASAVRVLDAAGFDLVVVETVGVGQVELEVVALADTVLVLCIPGLGDAYQLNKAGLMEVGDVYVVNQADRPETPRFVRELRTSLALGRSRSQLPAICPTNALTGEGVDELWRVVDEGFEAASASGELAARRRSIAELELAAAVRGCLRLMGEDLLARSRVAQRLADEIADGAARADEAALELLRDAGVDVATLGRASDVLTSRP